jgi:alginate O-acetyltransferase complex protein AlgI
MIQSAVFWLVLLASVIIFWLLPKKIRLGFLALASFGYLATIEPVTLFVLLGWTLAFYWLAPLAIGGGSWQRWLLPTLILSSLAYLAYFKYIPPLIVALSATSTAAQLLIPLGISYFTFKFIHYAVEVKRGNIKDRSLQQFLCYIFLFPIFTAGPIERFDHFLANQEDKWQPSSTVEGITRIIHGLIKKFFIGGIVIVALMGSVKNSEILLSRLTIFPDYAVYKVWGFLVLSYLYMYMDFSAYSDIAIGASKLFGIRIMENFNFPILAPNIGIFWERWHMTLGRWCKTYIYMPTLGLTRSPYLATFSTMLIIGLWHMGSFNWICWGLYHAGGIAVFITWARFKRKKKWLFLDKQLFMKYLGILITFLFVTSAAAFTVTYQYGGLYGTLRILAKLLFINLPA